MRISQDMKDYFVDRTTGHIFLVQKYCEKISKLPIHSNIIGKNGSEIIRRGSMHDASKFESPEVLPYIKLTWKYKSKNNNLFSPAENDEMHDATIHHVKNNRHHPEFFDDQNNDPINRDDRDGIPKKIVIAYGMGLIDICEMCADWCAMSEEKGGAPQDWAKKVIGKRYKFSSYQEDFIYALLNSIWSV